MNDAAESLDPLRLPLTGERLIEASAGTGKTFTIAALYLRLLLGLALGLLVANLLEALRWTRHLARLAAPLARAAHLRDVAGASFSLAFVSPAAANGLLSDSHNIGELSNNELMLANLFNSLPAYLVHTPTIFLLTWPVLGMPAVVYVGLTLLAAVGLAQAMDKRPGELSGGMQQRVAIARALVMNPPLVLADEPTGNLDTASSAEVFALLRRIHAERGTSFVVVTHDPRLAARCDRLVELIDGRIACDEAVTAGVEPAPSALPVLGQRGGGALLRAAKQCYLFDSYWRLLYKR